MFPNNLEIEAAPITAVVAISFESLFNTKFFKSSIITDTMYFPAIKKIAYKKQQ